MREDQALLPEQSPWSWAQKAKYCRRQDHPRAGTLGANTLVAEQAVECQGVQLGWKGTSRWTRVVGTSWRTGTMERGAPPGVGPRAPPETAA